MTTDPKIPHVYIACVDYGYEGVSKDPNSFVVFASKAQADDFVRRADGQGGHGQRIVIAAEWVE